VCKVCRVATERDRHSFFLLLEATTTTTLFVELL
jgi:hypothetical protein